MFSRGERRGVTLIEVLVVLGLTVVVSGILLSVLINTRRQCVLGQERLTAQGASLVLLEQIAEILATSARPDSLDGLTAPPALAFEEDRCVVISASNATAEGYYLSSVSETGGDEGSGVGLVVTSLDGSSEVARRDLGVAEEGFTSKVTFEYAFAPAGGELEPAYLADLEPGSYPLLVRLRVRTDATGEGRTAGFEVVTTVELP